ncbi:AAA family ATPase [Pedobacter panaciterrae]
MRIKKLYIRNFRGFEEKEFSFDRNFIVAIGNNGLGKSTLLKAVQVSLGAFLQSMPLLPATPIYRRQFKKDDRLVKFDAARKDFLPNKELPLIRTEAEYKESGESKKLIWSRIHMLSNSTTHNRHHSQGIIDYATSLFDHHGDDQETLYPVLANFQINRTSAQVRKVDSSWKRMSKIAKGYYSALGESVDFTGVYEWLYSYDKCIQDGVEFEGTREALYAAIKMAIPFIKEIEYNSKYEEFELLVDYGKEDQSKRMLASLHSDGMKAMLYMVTEIAYRCIMLNGKLGLNAVSHSPGVVLIDEIDMHLHPIWQRQVVADLKGAFPGIQFIVTTHSPFIVQSLKAEELINLDEPPGLDQDPDKYSIEEVTEKEMGVENVERSEEFLEMIREAEVYFKLIKAGAGQQEIKQAKIQLDRLRIKYNSNPAYVALLEAELPKLENE